MGQSFLIIVALILASLASINILARHLDRIKHASTQSRGAEEGALGVVSLQLKGLNEFLKTPGKHGKKSLMFAPARWIVEKVLFVEQYIISLDRCQDNLKSKLNVKSHSLHFLVSALEVVACLIFKLSLWIYEILRFFTFAEMRSIEQTRNEMWNTSKHLSPGHKKCKVIFIRHGESLWNEAFNRGLTMSSLCSMLKFIGWELLLIFSMDSVIFDSPLSKHGIEQATDLRQWLEQHDKQEGRSLSRKVVELIRNAQANGTIRYYSSNLRRAISTLVLACHHFFLPDEKIVISSVLQEVTRNPDGISLSAQHSNVISSKYEIENNATDLTSFYTNNIEWGLHSGNISLNSTLEERFEGFLEDLNTVQEVDGCNTIVVCGHSLWIREFFKLFIDPKVDVNVKTRKLVNCGVVLFDLYERSIELETTNKSLGKSLANYYIEPGSIELNKESCL